MTELNKAAPVEAAVQLEEGATVHRTLVLILRELRADKRTQQVKAGAGVDIAAALEQIKRRIESR